MMASWAGSRDAPIDEACRTTSRPNIYVKKTYGHTVKLVTCELLVKTYTMEVIEMVSFFNELSCQTCKSRFCLYRFCFPLLLVLDVETRDELGSIRDRLKSCFGIEKWVWMTKMNNKGDVENCVKTVL